MLCPFGYTPQQLLTLVWHFCFFSSMWLGESSYAGLFQHWSSVCGLQRTSVLSSSCHPAGSCIMAEPFISVKEGGSVLQTPLVVPWLRHRNLFAFLYLFLCWHRYWNHEWVACLDHVMAGWLWVILERSILNRSLWQRLQEVRVLKRKMEEQTTLCISSWIRCIDSAELRSVLISLPYAMHLLQPPRPCLLLPAACVSTDSWEAYVAKISTSSLKFIFCSSQDLLLY